MTQLCSGMACLRHIATSKRQALALPATEIFQFLFSAVIACGSLHVRSRADPWRRKPSGSQKGSKGTRFKTDEIVKIEVLKYTG